MDAKYQVGVISAGQQIGGAEVICVDLALWLHARGVKCWLHVGRGGKPQIRSRLEGLPVRLVSEHELGSVCERTDTVFLYGTQLIAQSHAARVNKARRVVAFVGGFGGDYVTRGNLRVDTYLAETSAVPRYMKAHYAVKEPWFVCRVPVLLQYMDALDVFGYACFQEPFVYGVVDRLIPRKRVGQVIRAFKKLDANALLVIVGDGGQRSELKRLADNDARILFTGLVQDRRLLLCLLKSFDVLVSASQWECCGRVKREAMALRVPQIVTAGYMSGRYGSVWPDGTTELLIHRWSALIRSADDFDGLVECMREMRRDAGLRKRLADQARVDIEHFNAEDSRRLLEFLTRGKA